MYLAEIRKKKSYTVSESSGLFLVYSMIFTLIFQLSIYTTLWANSADDKLTIFFRIFPRE